MKPFKDFNNSVSWNTKFYILLVFALLFFMYLFQNSGSTYALPAIFAVVVVLLVNFAIKYFIDHPRVWNMVRWVVLLLLMLLVLIGAQI